MKKAIRQFGSPGFQYIAPEIRQPISVRTRLVITFERVNPLKKWSRRFKDLEKRNLNSEFSEHRRLGLVTKSPKSLNLT